MKYDLEGICQDCMYLEKVKPLFEEKDKEIDRLKGALQTHEILLKTNVEEIDRLRNIINELESYLEQQWLEWKDDYNDEIVAMANEDKAVLDKLKELKEDNK